MIQKFEKIVIIYIGGENMSVVPYVVQQTGNGERNYDIFSRLLCDRIIFLGEEVTDASASVVIATFIFRGRRSRQRYLSLYKLSRRFSNRRICNIRYNATCKM